MFATFLILLLLFVPVSCVYGFQQISIPLSNAFGIPYTIEDGAYEVDGFEIDSENNFYLNSCGKNGKSMILVKISSENKIMFKKTYKDISSVPRLKLNKGILYGIDNTSGSNDLVLIDARSGDIVHIYKKITTNIINSYEIFDSFIIIESYGIDRSAPEKIFDFQFDLTGRYIKQVNNLYDLPDSIFDYGVDGTIEFPMVFLEKWKNMYVFGYHVPPTFNCFVLNSQGQLVKLKKINNQIFGHVFFGAPEEHQKIRNERLYMLCYKKKMAVITIYPLNEMFLKCN